MSEHSRPSPILERSVHHEAELQYEVPVNVQDPDVRIEGNTQIARGGGKIHQKALKQLADSAVKQAATRETLDAQIEESNEGDVDVLTELGNTRALKRYVDRIMERAEHTSTRFWVGIYDLDGAKAFNDEYGHTEGGDVYIKAGAEAGLKAIHPGDEVFRNGGDEFTVVMQADEGVDPEEIEKKFRSRLSSRLDDEVMAQERLRKAVVEDGYSYGVSFGLAPWDPTSQSWEEAYIEADAHLYEDKTAHHAVAEAS